MTTDSTTPTSMFGTFNLRDGTDLPAFKQAFDAFCEHLQIQGFVASWRVWHRAYHAGYDARFPDTAVIVEMCFHTHQAALDSWDYIEGRTEPIHALHADVNRRVTDAHFVLGCQV